jgi:hypothetical protein
MTLCRRGRAWTCVHVSAGFMVLATAQPSDAQEKLDAPLRPPLSAACRAWDAHIDTLIDEHRLIGEISEPDFFEVMRLYYAARSACLFGSFTEGLAIYSSIPIGRPKYRLLR